MGYQSRLPLGALKEEAVSSYIEFTLGLFDTQVCAPANQTWTIRCTFIHARCNWGRAAVPVTESAFSTGVTCKRNRTKADTFGEWSTVNSTLFHTHSCA